jgi:hypothetical protein
MYVCECVCLYIHGCVSMYMCIYASVCLYICVCVCVCMCVCVCVCLYTVRKENILVVKENHSYILIYLSHSNQANSRQVTYSRQCKCQLRGNRVN